MKYSQIQTNIRIEINRIKKEEIDTKKCASHPSYFAKQMLGIIPYGYQHMILNLFKDKENPKDQRRKNDRVIICKSRQIGISVCLACLAIWYAWCNKSPSGVFKDTKVGIISRDDRAAVKLMGMIQKIVWNSPYDIGNLVKKDQKNSLSKKEIHFRNGWVKCFPPTRAAAGETFDILILDEAAFVEDEILIEVLEPTVAAVNGKIILSSTPNGQSGYFFEIFDPDDLKDRHEYNRFWFHWSMCENKQMWRIINQKFKFAKDSGNIKSFDQEYNALFTVDEEAFFANQDVERGLDRELGIVYEDKNPCSVGIDYGMTSCATVITVVALVKDTIKVLFQFAQVDLDENLLMDENWEHSIPKLTKRYNIQHIVVDDCPMGGRTNRQLENEGYPLVRFNFRADSFAGERNRGYYLFRTALKHDKIKYPELRKLMAEMKCLQEIKMEGGKYMKIKAPQHYRDDRPDSLMIACYPFLQEEGSFSSIIVDYEKAVKNIIGDKKRIDGRFDEQWEKINIENNPYDFLLKEETRGRPSKIKEE